MSKSFYEYSPGEQRLFHWIAGRGTGFTSALFECIARADKGNRDRLAIAFPEEVQAYNNWQEEKYGRNIPE